ncbi:hypothetical protein QAD02_004422 [Eretmocerus hayati]|uniref:Uncharacterized protein n=1 Tax=Eretmocerus hayati TaxID=131215 RepID=A0ACC2NPP5_9HYME|nr:hypothetical protein QAD02_004422 [Eretmocerus hayati]
MGISVTIWSAVILSLILTSNGQRFFEPGEIHFPLRNVHQSIRFETFSTSDRNVTAGRCDQVSDQRVVLNLRNLGHIPPPNPYPGFIDSPMVNCVDLSSNEIFQVVPGSFDQVPNLSYLDLSRNRLQFCDFLIFGNSHPSLKTLIIEDNSPPMDNIDKTISKADCLPKLRYLYLRRNSLRQINFSLRKAFPMLSHLYLSDNNLDSQNFIRDLPHSLTHLYLERNLLSGLDCRIAKDLQVLHLDGNIFRSVCYRNCRDTSLRLDGVHKLTTLTISKNRISDVESCAFQDTTSLAILNLAQNNIEELKRDTFESLTMLRELNLDDNRLKSIPNLCKNTQLTSLSLRQNKLQSIKRENFKNLRSLKCLRLGGNGITSIESGSFEDLESLIELDLSDNGLDFIPTDWLKWQWSLRTLDVRGNKFKCLEQMSLGSAPFLNTIYMQNNPVTHISGSIVSKLASNVVIHLKNDCTKRSHGATDCYTRCDEAEVRSSNETYLRWINGQ